MLVFYANLSIYNSKIINSKSVKVATFDDSRVIIDGLEFDNRDVNHIAKESPFNFIRIKKLDISNSIFSNSASYQGLIFIYNDITN